MLYCVLYEKSDLEVGRGEGYLSRKRDLCLRRSDNSVIYSTPS